MGINPAVADTPEVESDTYELEMIVQWDPSVEWEALDEHLGNSRDSIEVTVHLSGDDIQNASSKGTLSTVASVQGFLLHLMYDYLPRTDGIVDYSEINGFRRISDNHFDTSIPGRRRANILTEVIPELSRLRYKLDQLGSRAYIHPRDDDVNMCDYWCGFFGTSAGMWTDSRYPRANPSEYANQLAYEVEQGIRDIRSESEFSLFFPDTIHEVGMTTPGQLKAIRQMNEVLFCSKTMEKDELVGRLRELAVAYDKAGE